jgi:hypothetical protein
MISERAKTSFNKLLSQAISEHLVAGPSDTCEVQALTQLKRLEEREFVILTISSYLFRLMVLFHFTFDPKSREHFASLMNTAAKDMDRQAFNDAVAEFGNLACGALNRELGKYFPHVGMSTPNILERECLEHLSALDATYLKHFRILVNGTTEFHATLCVSVFGDLDFLSETKTAEETTGELELF